MKQTIIIRPAQGISINTALLASYRHPESKEIVTLTIDKKIVAGKLSEHEKPFRYKFQKYNNRYVIEYITGVDKNIDTKAESELKFWSKHPNVKSVGGDNKYLQNELFTMEVLEDIEKKAYERSFERLRISNMINNLDDKNRYDICFLFGGNPTGKETWQIWADLIGEQGRLFEGENTKKIVDVLADSKKEEVMMKTILKKAIHYQVIITENNKYYTKQRDLLGMSEEDVFAFYSKNAEMFEYIKSSVAGLDVSRRMIEDKKEAKVKA